MIRTLRFVALAALWPACSSHPPAKSETPAATPVAKGPGASAPECPQLEPAIVKLIGPVEEGMALAVRQCVLVDSQPAPTWFAVGSIGQPDDSESEEGWSLIRFLADADGAVLARGPDSGASWMTGVSTGQIDVADLDGDGKNEILETRDQYLDGDVMNPIKTLTVYRRKGAELVVALSLVLHRADTDADSPDSAPAACSASYKVADNAGKPMLEVLARRPSLEADDPEPIAVDESEAYVQAIDDGDVRCLDAGTYQYRFSPDGAAGARVK